MIDTYCVPGTELGTIHVVASWQLSHRMSTHIHTHTHSRTNSSLRPPKVTKGSTQTRAFMSNRMRSPDKEGIHIADIALSQITCSAPCPFSLHSDSGTF